MVLRRVSNSAGTEGERRCQGAHVSPQISSDPAGFPEMNDRGNELTSGHLLSSLNLPSPVVLLYGVDVRAALCSTVLPLVQTWR